MTAATRAAPDAAGARRLTTRWRAKDGSLHWIEWSLRTVRADRMVYASGRDVTQQLLAERALAGSESRYRTLVDGLPDTAVFLVDARPARRVRRRPGAARRRDRAGASSSASTSAPSLPQPDVDARSPTACAAALARRGAQPRHRLGRARPRAVAAHEPAARRRARADRRRDAHRPGRPRRVEREREIGEAQERFRRAFEDAPIGMAVADARRPLPRGQPGAVRDHGLHRRAAHRHALLDDHPPRGRRRRPRGDARRWSPASSLVGRREALPAPRRLGRVGRAQRHARARRRRRAAALPRPDPGHHRAPPLRARAAPARRPRSADGPAQPPPLRAGARPPRRATSRATARAARCSCSTSTTSSTSTTRSATTPATS